MATLINGDGNQAISAQQDADWFASIMGGQTLITAVGNKFAYELLDANTIGVKDGVIITKEGRRIQLDANAIDSFNIPTGGQGTTNYYIIGYHLVTGDLSEQTAETFVQLMDNATDTIPEGSFRDGDNDVYISLYRVQQNDLTLGTITLLLPQLSGSLQIQINELNNDLANKADRSELVPFTTFKTNNDGAHIKMQISTQAYDDSAIAGKFNVCQWNSDTNDTPFKSGLTAFGNGFIITYKISEQYYTQLAMAVGDTDIFSRRCDNGSWSSWEIVGGKTSTNSATFNSGITINSQTLRKRGSIVVFGFNLTLPTTSSDTVIGTLPIGYRPSADIYGIAEKNNPYVDTIEQGFCIKTNGDIQLTNESSGGICRGSITFII